MMPSPGPRNLICALAIAVSAAGGGAPRADGRHSLRSWLHDRVQIPAGPFIQGSIHGEEDERPARTSTLSAFSIDRTEVTLGDYTHCLVAHRCRPLPGGSDAADPRLPVANVTWADAQAFCRYAGGRLPTEAEWEKAARGTDGREYPWGGDAQCARANWGNFDGEGPCAGRNPGHPVAVGQYPDGASPYGVLDLGGNVWEWVADRYDDEAASIAPAPQPRRDRRRGERPIRGAGRAAALVERRLVKGGSCCSFFVGPRAANRNAWAPDHRDFDLGFRCAADR
jgi:formylglycine-generating enzyme required for sulfatase activity